MARKYFIFLIIYKAIFGNPTFFYSSGPWLSIYHDNDIVFSKFLLIRDLNATVCVVCGFQTLQAAKFKNAQTWIPVKSFLLRKHACCMGRPRGGIVESMILARSSKFSDLLLLPFTQWLAKISLKNEPKIVLVNFFSHTPINYIS